MSNYQGMLAVDYEDRIDFPRLRRERIERTVKAMREQKVDALILQRAANVRYTTGARTMVEDAPREYQIPAISVVFGDGRPPYLFTAEPDGVPPGMLKDHVLPPFVTEYREGVKQMGEVLRRILGDAARGRIGVDDLSPAMYELLPEELPGSTLVDAARPLREARKIKTPDEIECLKVAQQINEAVMFEVVKHIKPGVREMDLTSFFLKRMVELGISANHVDPIFRVAPTRAADVDWPYEDDPPLAQLTSDRILREGDSLIIDTGLFYNGYCSDFGRTWWVGRHSRPSAKQKDLYRRWREVYNNISEVLQPGKTLADVNLAARKMSGKTGTSKPWCKALYVAHGIGCGVSAEQPFVGTDMGMEYEREWVLQPGMVMILEPVIFEEGVGMYRAEESIVITPKGFERFTNFPHGAFAED